MRVFHLLPWVGVAKTFEVEVGMLVVFAGQGWGIVVSHSGRNDRNGAHTAVTCIRHGRDIYGEH